MDATREAERLVGLWQQLQAAQVAGDLRQLAGLGALAASEAERPGASEEWRLLAREAARHAEALAAQSGSQPTAGVGAREEVPQVILDGATAPEQPYEPVEGEEATTSRGRGLGGLIWVVILVGYLLLQLIGGLGDSGP